MVQIVPITDYLHPEDVCLPLCADSAEGAIRLLVRHIHNRYGGFDLEAAVQAVMAREAVMPVIMERELAMPHARLPNLEKPRLAVGVCPVGIPFSNSADPVKVIVLTLTPSSDPNLYLRVLAAVTKSLRSPQAISRIAAAHSAPEVMSILGISHEHLPDFLAVRHMMNQNPVVLRDTDTLGQAIELFSAKGVTDLPVVDAQNNVLGTIAIEDLLRLCLPAHLRWMEDLSPILRFEPFAELVKRESGFTITRFLREDILSIAPDTPAIQLAKLFLLDERRQVVVMEGRRLVGTVDLTAYVRKLFWD
jgi:mannitol/fructose-specific phosphotransferase system IIA component (Ntr-type)/CBS domain-containing protein